MDRFIFVLFQECNMNLIILAGAPGCGKGEQGKRLASLFPDAIKMPPMSTLLERRLKCSDQTAMTILESMNAGKMVDDAIVADVFFDSFKTIQYSQNSKNIVIVDGFPRTLAQYQACIKSLYSAVDYLNLVYLDMHTSDVTEQEADRELCLRMLARRDRPTDEQECLHRISVFKKDTLPFLARAEKDFSAAPWTRFIRVSAWSTADVVQEEIVEALGLKSPLLI